MPSLLKKLSFYDAETGRKFVVADDGFYWKQAKKSPEESKVTKLLTSQGWHLMSGNDVWLIFKKRGLQGELTVMRGSKEWYWDRPGDDMYDSAAEGKGLDTLQQALDSGEIGAQKAMAMHASPGATAVNNAGAGHNEVDGNPLLERRVGRSIMHDDSGAETGLRSRPDYGESDSFTSEMNDANSKGACLILSGGVKSKGAATKIPLYVTHVTFEKNSAFKLLKFRFSPDPKLAMLFRPKTAENLQKQIRRLGALAVVAAPPTTEAPAEAPAKPEKAKKPKPVDLLTTQNIKTQKQYQPSLLTDKNLKTQKGEERSFLTGVMHMMPSDLAGYGNVCPCASKECRDMCLNTAGQWANTPAVQNARKQKTELYFKDREKFMNDMRRSIQKLLAKAEKQGLTPAIRINGTSDLPQVAMQMAKEFPQVQFYDYTKIPRPWERQLPNYHITFSRSENNEQDAIQALEHGVNVAVVFGVEKGKPLPKEWKGYAVIDGDLHDLRFLDNEEGVQAGVKGPFVIGLRGKGKARGKDKGTETGFVVDPTSDVKKPELVQIMPAGPTPPKQSSEEEDEGQVWKHAGQFWFVGGVFDDAHFPAL